MDGEPGASGLPVSPSQNRTYLLTLRSTTR